MTTFEQGCAEVAEIAKFLDAEPLDQWWIASLLEQLDAAPPGPKHWVMSRKTANLIRTIAAGTSGAFAWRPPDPSVCEMLLGFPVHVEETAKGATLEPVE